MPILIDLSEDVLERLNKPFLVTALIHWLSLILPEASARCRAGPSLDHLIGPPRHRRQDGQTEDLRRVEVDDHSNFVGCSTGSQPASTYCRNLYMAGGRLLAASSAIRRACGKGKPPVCTKGVPARASVAVLRTPSIPPASRTSIDSRFHPCARRLLGRIDDGYRLCLDCSALREALRHVEPAEALLRDE